MTQLIIILVSIALASYAIMAGFSYVDLGSMKAKEQESFWANASLSLAQAWQDIYHRTYRLPKSALELANAASTMGLPSGFSVSDLTTNFNGWCITGSAYEADLSALESLAKKFPSNYGVSSTCGYTGGVDSAWRPAKPISYPVDLVITYRLSEK